MKDGLRARYTLEFRQEAVRLVRGDEKLSTVACPLRVLKPPLHNWVKADGTHRHSRADRFALTTANPANLSRAEARV